MTQNWKKNKIKLIGYPGIFKKVNLEYTFVIFDTNIQC